MLKAREREGVGARPWSPDVGVLRMRRFVNTGMADLQKGGYHKAIYYAFHFAEEGALRGLQAKPACLKLRTVEDHVDCIFV